jgi:hypothetical protein
MGMVGLMALKANRRWSAWWIWLPLACVAAGAAAGWGCIEPGLQELRSVPWLKQVLSVLFDAPAALAFGLGALCLLVPNLDCTERFGTALRILILLSVLSVANFAVAGLWNEGLGDSAVPLLFLPGLLALDVAAAVVMAGLACRRRHSLWLCLWFPVSLAVFSMAVAVPVYFVAVAVCPIPLATLGRLVVPIGVLLSAGILATLLPFLVLTLVSPWFRGRVKVLFCLPGQVGRVT